MKNKIDKKVLFSIMIGIILSLLTNVVAETLINSKDVSYVDNSNLKATNVQAAIDGTCTKFSTELQNFLLKVYPVGSIYISYNSTNPGTLFGGTWENYGNGRVLKGINSGTAGAIGGSSTVTLTMSNIPAHTHTYDKANANTDSHTLTIDEMPKHSHNRIFGGNKVNFSIWGLTGTETVFDLSDSYKTNGSAQNPLYTDEAGGDKGHTHPISTTSTNTGSAGSANPAAISVQDPYITVYMWRRTK